MLQGVLIGTIKLHIGLSDQRQSHRAGHRISFSVVAWRVVLPALSSAPEVR